MTLPGWREDSKEDKDDEEGEGEQLLASGIVELRDGFPVGLSIFI